MPLTTVDQGLLSTNAQYTGFKNRLINGQMQIDQRNAGASLTPINTQYGVDRWAYGLSQASKFTSQQSSTAPAGFVNSTLITSSSSYSSLSTDYFWFEQKIEGLNCSDLGWGAANAQPVTLSFQVRSSLTGTFGGSLTNSALNRSYPFTYTISSANTWTSISVTIAGDTSGTWLTTNGVGIRVAFNLGSGSNYQGTANTWTSGFFVSATGATSVVGTNGATFYITGVQLEKGSTATSFDYRPYGTELALCQRYYELSSNMLTVFAQSTTAGKAAGTFQVAKRTPPSVALTPGCAAIHQYVANSFASGNNGGMGTISLTTYVYGMTTLGYAFDYTNSTAIVGGTGFIYIFNVAGFTAPFLQFSAEL